MHTMRAWMSSKKMENTCENEAVDKKAKNEEVLETKNGVNLEKKNGNLLEMVDACLVKLLVKLLTKLLVELLTKLLVDRNVDACGNLEKVNENLLIGIKKVLASWLGC